MKNIICLLLFLVFYCCGISNNEKSYTSKEEKGMKSIGINPVKDYKTLEYYRNMSKKLDSIPKGDMFKLKYNKDTKLLKLVND